MSTNATTAPEKTSDPPASTPFRAPAIERLEPGWGPFNPPDPAPAPKR